MPPLDTGRCLQLPPQLRFCVPSTLQRRAGAKGFGLFAAQDLEEGQFIIQYLGEVSSCDDFCVGALFKPCTFAPAELAPHGAGPARNANQWATRMTAHPLPSASVTEPARPP